MLKNDICTCRDNVTTVYEIDECVYDSLTKLFMGIPIKCRQDDVYKKMVKICLFLTELLKNRGDIFGTMPVVL